MKRLFQLFLFLILYINLAYAQLNPSKEWVKIYDGPGASIDMTNDAKIDKDYNLYLAGRSAGIDGSQDLLILKYSRFGELISEIRYVSAQASWEEANSIAVDSSGNLYCIGSATFGTSSFFTIIQKYSPASNLIWNKNFYNTSGQYSEGIKIIIDNANNIIAGYNLDGACFTKYTSSGDSLWTVKVSNDTSIISIISINNIITDSDNNIYATVIQSNHTGGEFPEIKTILLKYDQNGNIIWNKSLDINSSRKLIFDNESYLLLITNEDGKIFKFNSSGDSLWCFDLNCLSTDIAIDNKNNILLSGYSGGIGGLDYSIKKLSSSGSETWNTTFNSSDNLRDVAMAVTVDNDNNIYTTGLSHDMITQGVCNTLKYNPDGELLWQYRYDAPHSIFENPYFIFLDDSNNIFIAGDVADSTNGWNFFALKISQKLGTNIEQYESSLPIEYYLSQNYPNPFNPSTIINYSIPKQSNITIKIYDVLGREVTTLVNEVKNPGNYSVEFNAGKLSSGVYIYTLQTSGNIISKKMLLMK